MIYSRSRVALALVAGTLSLAACSASPDSASKTSSGAAQASGSATGSAAQASGSATGSAVKLHTAVFVSPLPDYPQWRSVGSCMQKEAQARGVKLTITGPTAGQGATVMLQQLQQAVADKVQAVITSPTSDAFGAVLTRAQKAGIITATIFGSGTPDSGADVNYGVDFGSLGKQYVAAIATRKGQQNVGLLAAGDFGTSKPWMDGIKAAAKQTKNVHIVAQVYTNDDSSKALPQTNALLQAHPYINVLASILGTVTPGATAAIKAKGLTGKVVLFANGSDNGGLQALRAGTVGGVAMANWCGVGKQTFDAVADRAAGKKEPGPLIQSRVVTSPAEAQSLIGKGWQ